MFVQGKVYDITAEQTGSELLVDASVGATTLFLEDAYDFNETGGTIVLNGVTITYTAADHELDTLTIPALGVAAVIGDKVLVYPYGAAKYAMVDLNDSDEGVRALVPFAMHDRFDEGIRDIGDIEDVLISDERGRWEVVAVDEEIPTILGGFIDTTGMPPPPSSDGDPPTVSPPVSIRPFGYSGLMITWPAVANPDPVKYRVFLGLSSPPVGMLTETAGLAVATSVLPDGTPLVPGTIYFAQVMAFDEDGDAPARGADAWSAPTVVPADAVHEDILVANEIYSREGYFGSIGADKIEAGEGLFADLDILGQLSVGPGITIDPTSGIVVVTPQGETQFPTDGSNIKLSAEVTAAALEVLGSFTMRGTNNDIAKNAELSLATGVSAPKSAPGMYGYYPSHTAHQGYDNRGLVLHTTPTPDLWYSGESFVGDCGIMAMAVDGSGNYVHNLTSWSLTTAGGRPEASNMLGGLCLIGDTAYMLVQTTEAWTGTYAGRWYVYKATYNSPGNWTYVTRWRYLAEGDTTILSSKSANRPTIGTNGTDIFIAQAASTGNHYLTQYSTTGTLIAAPALMKQDDGTTNFTTNRHCSALIWTAADTGTGRWWLVHETYPNVYCFSSTRVRVSANEFPTASTGNFGFMWDGTRFKGRTADRVYDYSKIKDTDLATSPVNSVHTWRLADGTGPDFAAGETVPSPRAQSATIKKRMTIMVHVPSIPNDPGDASDPDSVTFYIARGTGTPANASYLRVVPPAAGAVQQAIDELPTTGGNPPTSTSGFSASGIPAIVQSAATDGDGAQIKMSGDGSGRMGPLAWTANTAKGPHAAKLTSGANGSQSIVHNTWTMSNLDETGGIEYNYGMTIGSNGFTITVAGLYMFTASVTMGIEFAAGRRLAQIERYTTEAVGAGFIVCRAETAGSVTIYPQLVMTGSCYMNVNDKVRVPVLHLAGAGNTVTVRHDLVPSFLTAQLIRV